ncbi:MAG: hypothetical protein ACI4O7_11365 [Aristaeellaceae bacterium]
MTKRTDEAFDAATTSSMTSRSAVETLMKQVQIRRFREVLAACADESSLRAQLTDGLCANDSTRSRASMDKKVRDWLAGRYQPREREDLFELCFILRMDADRAGRFLADVSDVGLHRRDPRELVYAYALDRGMTYPEARALYERVRPDAVADRSMATSYTPQMNDQAAGIRTEEELREYLRANAWRMGELHNTAYQTFDAMMKMLKTPRSVNVREEERYTTRDIVNTYLDKRLPTAREGRSLEEQKRCILADWPDEITLSRIATRNVDVSRKVLILLFLVTEGGDDAVMQWTEADEDSFGNPDLTDEQYADAVFRSMYLRLDNVLAACGFKKLDARNAFDWVVMYCMRSCYEDPDSLEGLNERLSSVLEILFAASAPEA